GNSTGPYTLIYPAVRLIDPVKVFTAPLVAGGGLPTSNAPLFQLPQSISVGPGSTLILDNTAANNNNRLPDTGLVVLNGSNLYVRENSGAPTQEVMGTLVLAANTSDSLRVDWGSQSTSFVRFIGGTGGVPLSRMDNATLNI